MHAVLQSPFINNTDHQTTNRMLNFNDRKSPSLTKLKPVPPPPPPYAPPTQARVGPANMSNLPINVLHRIIAFTLDSKATPSRFMGDDEEERVRRIFQLFYGLRGVDRRFYLSMSSITNHETAAKNQYRHRYYARYIYLPTRLM
jgi:hypothetical protein